MRCFLKTRFVSHVAGASLAFAIVLAGSASARTEHLEFGLHQSIRVQGFQGIAYAIADSLEKNLVQPMDRSKPILFTSFVDIDDLQSSSTFGRLLGEQVASRMAQLGYRIMELKLRRGSMIISEGAGEIILSRNLDNICNNHDAQAVIVGMYTVINESIVLTVKLLSAQEAAILASSDLTVHMSADLQALIQKNQTRIRQDHPKPAHEPSLGPIGRGTVLLDPKNPLGARIIQTRLAELGYYKDRVDGIWGRNSRAALSRFKADRQLPGTTWDLQTQLELFRGTGQ